MKWKNLNQYNSEIDELKKKTPYEILDIPEGSDEETIKKAYKKKVSENHPDRKSDFFKSSSDEKMKLINNAYEELMKK